VGGQRRTVVGADGAVQETRDDYPWIPLRSISTTGMTFGPRLRLVWAAHGPGKNDGDAGTQ
jgi:hypothetical protein